MGLRLAALRAAGAPLLRRGYTVENIHEVSLDRELTTKKVSLLIQTSKLTNPK